MERTRKVDLELTARLEGLASDAFLAVARRDLSSDAAVVQAIAAAMAYLRGRRGAADVDSERGDDAPRRSRSTMPVARGDVGMLDHALAIASLVSGAGLTFSEACDRRAAELSLHAQSIRGACCRAQGLMAADWNRLAAGDREARRSIGSRLAQRYPKELARIEAVFRADADADV